MAVCVGCNLVGHQFQVQPFTEVVQVVAHLLDSLHVSVQITRTRIQLALPVSVNHGIGTHPFRQDLLQDVRIDDARVVDHRQEMDALKLREPVEVACEPADGGRVVSPNGPCKSPSAHAQPNRTHSLDLVTGTTELAVIVSCAEKHATLVSTTTKARVPTIPEKDVRWKSDERML